MSENEISLNYKLHEDVIDPADAIGGIQILINGSRLNRFQKESFEDYILDWYPEYVGKILPICFSSIVKSTYRIAAGEIEIYESEITDFGPTYEYFLFEPISKENVRVAFRTHVSKNRGIIAPKSACGYVVDRHLFCQAVSDVSHDYINEVKSGEVLANEDMIKNFEASLAELDEAIEG